MAKIVFLSLPAFGHVNPALPIMAELVRRGHRVTIYSEALFEPAIRAVGADFVAYPPAFTVEALAAVLGGGNLIAAFDLILSATPPLADFCLPRLAADPPDMLVYDGTCLWGEIAARKLKLPSVSISCFYVFEFLRHLTGPAEFWGHTRNFIPGMPALARDWARMLRFGIGNWPLHSPMFPMRGDRTLMLTSRELHPKSPLFDDPRFLFIGASIAPATRQDSFDFSRLDGRLVIYISLGTVHFTNDRFFESAMAALADYPAQFLLSAGRGTDVSRFRDVPANFIVQETFPQLAVLERAALFVSHAGLNSMHESLWYGVPLICVPQQFEQFRNAVIAERGGAGINLDGEVYHRSVDGRTLRAAIDKVLADPSYRERSKALGQTLRDAGGFAAGADAVETVLAEAKAQTLRIKQTA